MGGVITKERLSESLLDDWAEDFHNLYSRQESDRSEAESWLQVVQHAAVVAEALRLEEYGECLEHLSRSFCHVCGFVARCLRAPGGSRFRVTQPLSQIVYEKYPGICPVCLDARCRCPINRYQPKDAVSHPRSMGGTVPEQYYLLEAYPNPMSLDRFVQMFDRIYGAAHAGLPVETIGFHFLEEIGEVSNAIRLLQRAPDSDLAKCTAVLEREIADVISWICNLFVRLRQQFTSSQWYVARLAPEIEHVPDPVDGLTFSTVLWDLYTGGGDYIRCPSCGVRPCSEDVPEPDAKSGARWRRVGLARWGPVIAIDGPSSSGKSTVAMLLAKCLGFRYVNTGAMYRAVAVKVLGSGVSPEDETSVAEVMKETTLGVSWNNDEMHVSVDGRDVTYELRKSEVDQIVARVSALTAVRKKLLAVQRRLVESGGVVMDGRDIGTVVFPEAPLKIFLKADAEERARRRLEQNRKEGRAATLEQTAYEIGRRDQLDAERRISPLVPARDACEIDSTHLTADQVVERILQLVRERKLAEV